MKIKLKNRQTRNLNKWWFIVIGASLILRLYQLHYPLLDEHAFRQTQTASTVRNYYKSGIALFAPKLDVFGIGKEETLVLEFPFYQAVVASLYRIFFPNEIWGRLVSIFFGFLGAFYLYKLVYLLIDKNTALWACFFFLFAPLNIFYHRAFLMDGTVVCFGLMMLFYYIHWIITADSSSCLKGIVSASIGFVMKPPYCSVLLLPVTYFQLKRHGFKGILKATFIVSIVIPVALMFLWQSHAESLNIKNGHVFFTMSNPGYLHWNFGKLEYRFSLDYWKKIFNIFHYQVMGRYAILFFLLGMFLMLKRENGLFFYLWLLTLFIYVLVFFRMVATHIYYSMPIVPITSVFCGYAVNYILGHEKIRDYFRFFKQKEQRKMILMSILACYVITANSIYAHSWFRMRWAPLFNGRQIQQHTKKDVPLIYSIPQGGWDSRYLYYANRRGINLAHKDILPENIAALQKKGYGYLAVTLFSLERKLALPYKIVNENVDLIIYDLNQRAIQ